MPGGAGRVGRVEDTAVSGEVLRVDRFEDKTHIAPKGQDLKTESAH